MASKVSLGFGIDLSFAFNFIKVGRCFSALLLVSCLTAPAAQLYATAALKGQIEQARYDLATAVRATRERLVGLEVGPLIPVLSDAIRGIEVAVFRDAAELAEPWRLLGDAYLQIGDTQAAATAYEQSIHISRVNEGLFSAEQLSTVYRQANLFQILGDLENATGREEYALLLERRKFADEQGADADPLALLPALSRLAKWYLKTARPIEARKLYEESVDSILRSRRESTDELVTAYLGIADAYRLERFPAEGFYQTDRDEFEWQMQSPQITRRDLFQSAHFTSASRALMNAEGLLQAKAQDSEADKARLSQVRIQLGDWNMLFEKWTSALRWYRSVFELWGASPETANGSLSESAQARLAEWFDKPVPLHLPLPTQIGDIDAVPQEMREAGYVELAFSLSPQGKVGRIETLETHPDDFRDIRVRRLLRESRYRPQIKDGKAVESERVVHRHEFTYIKQQEGDAL